MKTFATALFVVVLFATSTLAFGQSVDDLKNVVGQLIGAGQARQEKNGLSKVNKEYNADQPEVSLAGARTVIRLTKDGFWNGDDRRTNWLKAAINSAVTSVKGRPVWDDKELTEESAARRQHRTDDEIDQSSLPEKGKLKYRDTVLEFIFEDFDKCQDLSLAIGRWWENGSFRLSRETSYFGITLTVRTGDGEGLAVYKVLGSASTADNISLNIATGFFSSGGSAAISANSEEARRFRAMENALRELKAVIKQKCR